MRSARDLRDILSAVDGRGYKAYRQIQGSYDFNDYALIIDHAQSDPFAPPSRVRVKIPTDLAGFPIETYSGPSRRIALRDFLTRCFFESCGRFSRGSKGTGKSGLITIDRPGQEMLERTSMFLGEEGVEARFFIGLPAFGRKIAGREADRIFFERVPRIVRESLLFTALDSKRLMRHVETAEDADFLREKLGELGLVGFVADGAVLPRASGIDPRPMQEGRVVPFKSPASLKVEIQLPNRGAVTGMGIPRGITLIVGGGYHGKSTLLEAIALGVYNHLPGDGRELVVTDPDAVSIKAEDGRRIEKVDISPFISNLPFGRNTDGFSTEDASGSTSQAANIMEALEAGARLLLIDEDTSATNFMIRDRRMQELVAKEKEPITPFIDRVGQLYRERGVSTVLVVGGSGDYFDVAERVICMVEYEPKEVTSEARNIAERYGTDRKQEGEGSFENVKERIPLASSFDPSRGKREVKISSKGLYSIAFGTHTIDLGSVEQLVHVSQTRAIGDAIHFATKFMDGKRPLREILGQVMDRIRSEGYDVLSPWPVGDYAAFRNIELACAINRLRTLSIK